MAGSGPKSGFDSGPDSLAALGATLRQTLGLRFKRDIQPVAQRLGAWVPHPHTGQPIQLGDDCAAIPDGDRYLLLAAEAMWAELVEADPWFAGWCSVLVNVSDIYAMGGRPLAVVDAIWSQSPQRADPLWAGMTTAARTFNLPIVGGHTSSHSPYQALAVAILGQATHLITSFAACPGDQLVLVANVQGQYREPYPFWDAATQADPATLRQHLDLLPQIAEAGLCSAGKDISMGGIIGTALMLLETSGCGAVLDINAIPCPPGVPLERWLVSFPSYGFLLSVSAAQLKAIQPRFHEHGLVCQGIGQVVADPTLTLANGSQRLEFWNLRQDPLTGFGPRALVP